MAPKNKRAKGKAIKITEFAADYVTEDVYDFVDDSWMSGEEAKNEKLKEKLGIKEYRRTENNALCDRESFRNTTNDFATASEDLIASLKPPFVAHVGNLRNGITEQVFLSMFDETQIKTHRLINKEGKTFAFVEFATSDALACALCLDKTLMRGRQIYVNLANPKQIERLFEGDNPRSITSPNERSFGTFSRDLFGSTSNMPGSETTSPVSRDMFGSSGGQPIELELTRDIIGSAVDANSPDMPSSPLTFDNWRSEIAVDEPHTSDAQDNTNSTKSPLTDSKKRTFRQGGGNETQKGEPQSPLAVESWRSDGANNSRFGNSPKGGSAPFKAFNADASSWRNESSSSTATAPRKKVDATSSYSPKDGSPGRNEKSSSLVDDRWASLRR